MIPDVKLQAPLEVQQVLLHTCCAPCSSAIVECLLRNGITPVIFYSNDNIYPREEFDIREGECLRYARSLGLEVVEDPYDHERWLPLAAGLEDARNAARAAWSASGTAFCAPRATPRTTASRCSPPPWLRPDGKTWIR